MPLLVRRAGFLTTVQDLGRTGHRASGVSVGGALDPHALRIANLLVRNHENAAGLEMTLGTVRLSFEDDRLFAWCGGPFAVSIVDCPIPPGRPAVARAGEEIALTAPPNGARAWLAISGGIDVPLVLGSRATDLRSGFGGFEGRALRDGDVLKLADAFATAPQLPSRTANWSAPNDWSTTGSRHGLLRVIRGSEWSSALTQVDFSVASDSDRMGVRLEGTGLPPESRDRLSEPVAPGTIQLPPSGHPILLLGDCQTIGGYPKLAHVITVDLPAAAQLRPGDPARFVEVSLAEAQARLRERERDFQLFRAGVALRMPWS